MVCSHCQEPVHPYDLQRLFVNNGRGGMEERIFCEPCATAIRHGAIPIVPRVPRRGEAEKSAPAPEQRAPAPEKGTYDPDSGTPEPSWYRLLSA